MVPTRVDYYRICPEGGHPLRLGAGGDSDSRGEATDAAAVLSGAMRILIATDAWSPQVNGVVRSLQSLAANARKLGAEIEFLTPEGFRSFRLPTYPSIRCGIPSWREIARRIEAAMPDALHIATEGPIGQDAADAIGCQLLGHRIPQRGVDEEAVDEHGGRRADGPRSDDSIVDGADGKVDGGHGGLR